jgi:hypothetical protein
MQVHAYGSVPLRTYLPDGDVDVTILTNTSLDGTFIEDVRCLLVSEGWNDDAQFKIKNVSFIDAKVNFPGYTSPFFGSIYTLPNSLDEFDILHAQRFHLLLTFSLIIMHGVLVYSFSIFMICIYMCGTDSKLCVPCLRII